MIYRMRTYVADPANLGAFHQFFREHLLPIQQRHGARLIGRWETTDNRVIAIWEYDDHASFERIDKAVRSDPASSIARTARAALGRLFFERDEVFMTSTTSNLNDVIEGGLGTMQPFLVYLLGSPGVGKLTVARAIARQSGAVVVDNQLINIPIMSLFAWDGHSPAPPEIWDHIAPIRAAVFDTLAGLTPRTLSYVLTNVLEETDEGRQMFERVSSIAVQRDAVFVPVLLSCDLEEQVRRVTLPDRTERHKTRDAGALRDFIAASTLLVPDHPSLIRIDTTHVPPGEAAARVLAHVAAVSDAS